MLQRRALRVFCDMSQGWTVLMRRGVFSRTANRRISFEQDWNAYKTGFGDLNDEFWVI